MLLLLRSKLWRSNAGGNAITGTGASTQSPQTNSGRCLWYSPLLHRVHYVGASIKKLLESNEPIPFPLAIEGEGASRQARQHTEGALRLEFSAEGASQQNPQATHGVAYVIQPISGVGASCQESGFSSGEAENVDVELEIMAAILAAA